MKEQMNLEKSNKDNIEKSHCELVLDNVRKILKRAPDNENKKDYLLQHLTTDYGSKLAEEIIEILPEEIFTAQSDILEKFILEEIIFEKEIEKIYERVKDLPEKKIMQEVERILLEEYKISIEQVEEIKRSPVWKKFFTKKYTGGVLGILALSLTLKSFNIDLEKFNFFKKTNEKEIPPKEVAKPEIKQKETAVFDMRFNNELYKSLPEQGKEVYKYFAKYNPTPGRCYAMLDKENALMYIFGPNNELLAKFPPGFGKDKGDEPNTSKEYNKGKQTTPAGIYLLSDEFLLSKDRKEYGDLAFAMIGISVRGDKVYLAVHQTYAGHGQFAPRTEKLNSPSPEDNRFSNGCVNVYPENFENDVYPSFWADAGEFLFVLQDQEGKASGTTFNVNDLVHKIIPVMEEMANTQKEDYQKALDQVNKDLKENKINREEASIRTTEILQKVSLLIKKTTNMENFLAQKIDKQAQV